MEAATKMNKRCNVFFYLPQTLSQTRLLAPTVSMENIRRRFYRDGKEGTATGKIMIWTMMQ